MVTLEQRILARVLVIEDEIDNWQKSDDNTKYTNIAMCMFEKDVLEKLLDL